MSGGKEVTCTHRIKMGDSEQWHYISQQCRDRVSGEGEGVGDEGDGRKGGMGRRSERVGMRGVGTCIKEECDIGR